MNTIDLAPTAPNIGVLGSNKIVPEASAPVITEQPVEEQVNPNDNSTNETEDEKLCPETKTEIFWCTLAGIAVAIAAIAMCPFFCLYIALGGESVREKKRNRRK